MSRPSGSRVSTGVAPKSKSGPSSFGQLGPLRKPQAMLKASPAVAWKLQAISPVSMSRATMASDRSVAGVDVFSSRPDVDPPALRVHRPSRVVQTAAPDGPHICVPTSLL